MVRPVTQVVFDSIMLDIWPSNAGVADFGLHSQKHYEALHSVIRAGELKVDKLDELLGDGPALTGFINRCPSNRHPGIVFKTAWDNIFPQEEE